MRLVAGIDAGSRAIKIVLLDAETQAVVGAATCDQGTGQDARAGELLNELLGGKGLARGDLAMALATGYGRGIVSAAEATVTEITCHAVGVRRVMPEAMTVIEIGGQDSKLLRLDADGAVRDFLMNDRCAAGSGRFLEMLAGRLEVPLRALGELAAQSSAPAAISSMCVVFAETEIIALLAGGTPPADIVAGVESAIAGRVAAMVGRDLAAPVAFTGGVALVPGMDAALSGALRQRATIVPQPQMTGALGAAILAARRLGQGG